MGCQWIGSCDGVSEFEMEKKWDTAAGDGRTLMVGSLAAGRTAVDNCGHASSRRAAAPTWAKLWPDCDDQSCRLSSTPPNHHQTHAVANGMEQPQPAPGSLSWRLSSHPITLLTYLAFRVCKCDRRPCVSPPSCSPLSLLVARTLVLQHVSKSCSFADSSWQLASSSTSLACFL